ncbi:hypothetical protein Dda_1441 [Drechslerella dactyloides]|uniref:NmrA-like domain-containing protein n=1 Tax=Drechslerella dactyloides TaxID=74499 RepID=A0AAD6NLF0_DREDA|nr:hypothetical protein Dda_1441 [Drechslerella dactyloides]
MSGKNVLVIGASGNLGAPIVAALAAEPSISVTILTREGSTSTFPAGIPVKKADYNSHDSLVAAFKGQDTILSIVATDAAISQLKFVEAAVDAGVTRFYPTEYGSVASDDGDDLVTSFWDKVGMHGKFEVFQRIRELAAAGKLEYTLIANGLFFDWGLQQGFLGLQPKDRKAIIFGSGDKVMSLSTLDHVAKVVTWAVTHPDETRNRHVRFYSHRVTQNELLAAAEKVTGTKWAVERVSTADWVALGEAGLKAGNPYAGYQVLQGLVYDEVDTYQADYTTNDAPIKADKTAEEVVKEVLGSA